MSSWKIVQKYSPAPTTASGIARICKLFWLLTDSSSKLEWSIAHHHHPWHLPSPLLPFWGRSWIQGKRRNVFPSQERPWFQKYSPSFWRQNGCSDVWCKLAPLPDDEWDGGMQGDMVESETEVFFLFASKLPCLKFGGIHRLWSYPKPASFLERVQHYQVCPTLKSPALMVSSLHSYPPEISLSQKRKVKTRYWMRNISHMRTVKWNLLPSELMPSPTLDIFKTRLDKALSNLVQPHSWPYFEQEVGLETFWHPFQTELPYDPIILWPCGLVRK